MENTLLNSVMDIIDHSHLPQEDRDIWNKHLLKAPDELLEQLIQLLKEDADLLDIMTPNMKAKMTALESGGSFDAILADEQRMLQESITN